MTVMLTCQRCGVQHPYPGRGSYAKYCPEHRGPRPILKVAPKGSVSLGSPPDDMDYAPFDYLADTVNALPYLTRNDRMALALAVRWTEDFWRRDIVSLQGGVGSPATGRCFYMETDLPERYAHRYPEVASKLLGCLHTVATKLATPSGWEGLSCVAEELVLHALIDNAKTHADLGLELSDNLTHAIYDLAFADLDVLLLFQPEPTPEEIAVRLSMGVASQAFEDWFHPYGGQVVPAHLAPAAAPDRLPWPHVTLTSPRDEVSADEQEPEDNSR